MPLGVRKDATITLISSVPLLAGLQQTPQIALEVLEAFAERLPAEADSGPESEVRWS